MNHTLSSQTLVQIVKTVEAAREAKQRIPLQHARQTFYGDYDLWYYLALMDDRTCKVCMTLMEQPFRGTELRMFFPWHEVITADQILPNTHFNCRCTLLRITNLDDYLDLTDKNEPLTFISDLIGEMMRLEQAQLRPAWSFYDVLSGKTVKVQFAMLSDGIAGYSNDGNTIYVDPLVPDWVYPALIGSHETPEKMLTLICGMEYDEADRLVTINERHTVDTLGLDWNKYDAAFHEVMRLQALRDPQPEDPADIHVGSAHPHHHLPPYWKPSKKARGL